MDDPGGGVLPADVSSPHRSREREGRRAGRLHPEGEVHLLARDDCALDRLWLAL